jgi:DNA-binding PadR family transcriptional regulator
MTVDALATERDRVLEALAGDSVSSAAVARRMHGSGGGGATEALLFPALHGLEASGRLDARWIPDSSGRRRRTYRRRRLLPCRLGG